MTESRGALVRRYRELRRLTQTELGAATGMDQGSVSEIENEQREPGAETMARFANVLDIPAREVASAYTNDVGRQQASNARTFVVANPPRPRRRKN
jgi:transcriptional regulator with XRE-family HTH domain